MEKVNWSPQHLYDFKTKLIKRIDDLSEITGDASVDGQKYRGSVIIDDPWRPSMTTTLTLCFEDLDEVEKFSYMVSELCDNLKKAIKKNKAGEI